MEKIIIGIIITVVGGLILNYLSPNNSLNLSNNQNIQISNNQQSVSNSANGGSSSVIQNNNQSINIHYSNK